MKFTFEIYIDDVTGDKKVYIEPCDCPAFGASCSYETAEDIGKTIANYLDENYPDPVKNGGFDPALLNDDED